MSQFVDANYHGTSIQSSHCQGKIAVLKYSYDDI